LKIILEQINGNEEEQIVVKYRQLRPELLYAVGESLIGKIEGDTNGTKESNRLFAICDKEIFVLKPSDILYIESVEGKTFMYCENRVYESAQKLKELEAMLKEDNFLRISRTVLANLNNVRSFFPVLAGQLGATMLNGEKLIITRRYMTNVQTALGLQKGTSK